MSGRSAAFLGTIDWHLEIGRIIARLDSTDFPGTLVKALSRIVMFDHSVIFAYQGETRPIDLYDNFSPKQREVFVTLYQTGPYLLDPFYHACRDRITPGLYRMRNLAPDRFYQSEYFRSYYIRTGLTEEIGFFLRVPQDITVVISLMRAGESPVFTEREMSRLRIVEPVVREAASKHWHDLAALFAGGTRKTNNEKEPDVTLLQSIVQAAFQTFGRSVLTPRECEVVGLVLRGHSSESISRQLGIAPGTVRIHRRNIYAKLGISSQSELFSLFISSFPDLAAAAQGRKASIRRGQPKEARGAVKEAIPRKRRLRAARD